MARPVPVSPAVARSVAMSVARSVAMSVAMSVAVTGASGGCYYAFGTAPPAVPLVGARCTSSRTLPVVDTVLAGYGLMSLTLGAVTLAMIHGDGAPPADDAGGLSSFFAYTGAGMLIGHGLSAWAGFRDTARCRALPRFDPGVPPFE